MGTKYHLWTVLSGKKIVLDGRVYLKCQCECGVIKNVIIKNLKSGASKTCGCIRSQNLVKRNTRHGKRFTKVWRVWQSIKNRCYNKNLKAYNDYGGRGIKVCDRWKNDFNAFYEDVGDPPEGMSIDRINNNGNYESGNVRWATAKAQARNRRSNRKIGGQHISDISRNLGGAHSLVAKRLKRGWSVEKAISTKTNAGNKN